MLSPSEYKAIVSGKRRGIVASVLRAALAVAEIPYTTAVRWRNARYDKQQAEIHRVSVPVICVGNLTMGGTGKTPMVCFLAKWFRAKGIRIAIVSRGYRSVDGGPNDEAKELADKLPDVPHIQNPDRVAAATLAIDELEMQAIVMDDGFQHRRLARDLDIVLLDALDPFGLEHVFPRGMLREPLSGLSRAHVVSLSRADLVSPETRQSIRERVAELAPKAKWIEIAHAPTELRSLSSTQSLDELCGKNVVAFCGLGNPDGFRRTLESCDAKIVAFHEFPDHHDFVREDIDLLGKLVREYKPNLVVCTHKDLVKINVDQLGGVPLRALSVDLKLLSDDTELVRCLESIASHVQPE